MTLSAPMTQITHKYSDVRSLSIRLCDRLEREDFCLQAIPDVSPTKWHLAHTTWFFETFLLKRFIKNYSPVNTHFEYLFNSYYNGVGKQYPRSKRGLLSRPTTEEVFEYRETIDSRMQEFMQQEIFYSNPDIRFAIELGLNHEQQHQELMLTDIKFNLSCNPLYPSYQTLSQTSTESHQSAIAFNTFEGGLIHIGSASTTEFCFDNEKPRHKAYLEPFALANRLVTNAEYLAFIQDGAYTNSSLWLSDGWQQVSSQQWKHPLYWLCRDGEWFEFTLNGLQKLDLNKPVCHVSAYEADAFARWSEKRLPTEQEWEHAAANSLQSTLSDTQHQSDKLPHSIDNLTGINNNFLDSELFHPSTALEKNRHGTPCLQLFGDTWEWTSSSYQPYPGYQTFPGLLGEYNGKFMCNQLVLRGGSCVTPRDHFRLSYRNFFYPKDRWQFTGIRLANSKL